MKKLSLLLSICFCNTAFAQSPGLIVDLAMDSLKTGDVQFKIEIKICEPVTTSAINGYFTNDRSTIDFKKLTEKDITCGKYIGNYETAYPFYHFHYGNQVFAWEKNYCVEDHEHVVTCPGNAYVYYTARKNQIFCYLYTNK